MARRSMYRHHQMHPAKRYCHENYTRAIDLKAVCGGDDLASFLFPFFKTIFKDEAVLIGCLEHDKTCAPCAWRALRYFVVQPNVISEL